MPEIISIGYDLEEVRRFSKYLDNLPLWDGILNDLFTQEERLRNQRYQFPSDCYTLCFCAKEAMYKALGKSWMHGAADWKEIELLFEASTSINEYKLLLSGNALSLFNSMGAKEIHCLLQCDHIVANCNVVLSK